MERKIRIPVMEDNEITKWYETIKPIVNYKTDETLKLNSVYLRELTEEELSNISYTWLTKENYADKVDYSKLSVLADVKMLHRWSYYGYFKPSVGEIIRQIPKKMLEKVVAFEIIYSPDDWSDFNLFKEEFDESYHVSVVRLYQAKDDSNIAAEKIMTEYPSKEDTVPPIGMSDEEFHQLKDLIYRRTNNISDIEGIAAKVLENRKEKLKTIEERKKTSDEHYKKRVEHYAKLILDVFDASNLEEDSDLLVWKIEVEYVSKEKLKCSVSFLKTDEEDWQSIANLEKWEHPEKVKRVIGAMKIVEACEPTPTIISDIFECFIQSDTISSKYVLERFGGDRLKISFYDPSEEE